MWGPSLPAPLESHIPPLPASPAPSRRLRSLRIGYISSDFGAHVVGRLTEAVHNAKRGQLILKIGMTGGHIPAPPQRPRARAPEHVVVTITSERSSNGIKECRNFLTYTLFYISNRAECFALLVRHQIQVRDVAHPLT